MTMIGIILAVIGFGWALIGMWQGIEIAVNFAYSAEARAMYIILNGILYVIPGSIVGGIGCLLAKKNK